MRYSVCISQRSIAIALFGDSEDVGVSADMELFLEIIIPKKVEIVPLELTHLELYGFVRGHPEISFVLNTSYNTGLAIQHPTAPLFICGLEYSARPR